VRVSFYRLTIAVCYIYKESAEDNAAQYMAKQILSICAEPGGLCAMTSRKYIVYGDERETQRRNGDWQSLGDDALIGIMILPYGCKSEREPKHRHSVAGNG